MSKPIKSELYYYLDARIPHPSKRITFNISTEFISVKISVVKEKENALFLPEERISREMYVFVVWDIFRESLSNSSAKSILTFSVQWDHHSEDTLISS